MSRLTARSIKTSMVLAQRLVSRSAAAVRLVTKIRNQCNGIIARSLTDSTYPEENGEWQLLEKVAPLCRSLVDVGAHQGDWGLKFLKYATDDCSMIAFEPAPIALERLKQRWSGQLNVTIIGKACGDAVGLIEFIDDGSTSASVLVAQDRAKKDRVIISVPITTLDEEFSTLGITSVDYLKIDAEGLDYYVLRGADKLLAKGAVKYVQFEYSGLWRATGSTLLKAIDYLGAYKYSVCAIHSSGLKSVNARSIGEFSAYANFFAFQQGNRNKLEEAGIFA